MIFLEAAMLFCALRARRSRWEARIADRGLFQGGGNGGCGAARRADPAYFAALSTGRLRPPFDLLSHRYDLFVGLIVDIKNKERKVKKGVDKWENAWYSNQAVADEAAVRVRKVSFLKKLQKSA